MDEYNGCADASYELSHLSFLWESDHQQRAGIAIYEKHSGNLIFGSIPCKEYELPWIIECLKEQVVNPQVVITTSTLPDLAKISFEKPVASNNIRASGEGNNNENTTNDNRNNADHPDGSVVRIVKQSHFSLPNARKVIQTLTTTEWVRERILSNENRLGGPQPYLEADNMHGAFQNARILSLLENSDSLAIRAVGGLVHFLQHSKLLNTVEDLYSQSILTDLERERLLIPGQVCVLQLHDFLQADAQTMLSLGIFSNSDRTGYQRDTGKQNRSISLFALLEKHVSNKSTNLLRNWLLRPSRDPMVLTNRYDSVEFLINALREKPQIVQEISSALARMRNVERIISRLGQAKASTADWYNLEQSLASLLTIRESMSLLLHDIHAKVLSVPQTEGDLTFSANNPFLLQQTVEHIHTDLNNLRMYLNSVIDWDLSREHGMQRICIQYGIDETLDMYRKILHGLPAVLMEEAEKDLKTKYHTLSCLEYQYLPQIGCVAIIDKEGNGLLNAKMQPQTQSFSASAYAHSERDFSGKTTSQNKGRRRAHATLPEPFVNINSCPAVREVVPNDFEFIFETESSLYYNNNGTCAEINTFMGDAEFVIRDMERGILRQLEDRLLGEFTPILLVANTAAQELDMLLAFAKLSEEGCYVRPYLNQEPVLLAKEARNPLQESVVETYIANDITISPNLPDRGPISIITGPNGSGKSVYLRTIGLLLWIAQIGCFVPAENAVVGIADRCFTRITGQETSTASHVGGASSFVSDVAQITTMLKNFTQQSLLLIDEFGKGTSSIDGVSLLLATVKRILESPATLPPRCTVATHFREIFDDGVLSTFLGSKTGTPLQHVNFLQMKVILNELDSHGITEVTSLFKVIPGKSSSSYGLSCAKKAGASTEILLRAMEITQVFSQHGKEDGLHITKKVKHQEGTKGIGLASLRAQAARCMAELIMTKRNWNECTNDELEKILELLMLYESV